MAIEDEVKRTEVEEMTAEAPTQPPAEALAYIKDDGPREDHHPVSETKRIMTVGELLPEGGTVEPLRGGQLVLISGQRSINAAEIEQGDLTYQSLPLPSDLVKVLRLPRRAGPRTSVASLFLGLAEMAETRAGLVPAAARLWTAAVLATHLSGAIPVPVLNLWGGPGSPEAMNMAAVQLTTALVRRPLPLAELSWGEFLRLPAGLHPTVITALPSRAWLRRLLTAASAPGFVCLQGGAVVNFRCALVLCSAEKVGVPGMAIAVATTNAAIPPLAQPELESLADLWQARLLDYRARCWTEAAQFADPVAEFSVALQPIARSLLATLEGCDNLQAQLRTDLMAIDESYRSERSEGKLGAVVEALLALVITNTPNAYVHEVARLANAALTSRQEKAGLTPQEVGAILREQVRLTPRRMTAGYRVSLDETASERVRFLAAELGIDSIADRSADGAELPPATMVKDASLADRGMLSAMPRATEEGRL